MTAAPLPNIDALFSRVEWQPKEAPEQPGDLPYATHSGVLDLFGHKMRCYRLSSGVTVFDADDFVRFFEGAI